MKALRIGLFAVAMLMLVGGYAASQYAFLTGNPTKYAAQVDTRPVQVLAGILFLAAVVMPFLGSDDSKHDEEGSET